MLGHSWNKYYENRREVSADLGLDFERPGWYVSDSDYLLILRDYDVGYMVYCWNRPCDHPRKNLESILKMKDHIITGVSCESSVS